MTPTTPGSKAQMEIIGLVIIVILISVGLLFFIRFELASGPSTTPSERLPYSTMSSLMKATVTEPDCVRDRAGNSLLSLERDLIADCAINVDTPDYSQFHCRGQHSCVFVRGTMSELLRQTLAFWGRKYTLRSSLIPFQGQDVKFLFPEIISSAGGCPDGRPREASIFPIRTDAGLVQTTLYVCN